MLIVQHNYARHASTMLQVLEHHSSDSFPYLSAMGKSVLELRRTVASNLVALMQARDWSQETTAKKAGVSQRHISNMVNSKTSASFETLHAVAAAFGIPGWLLLVEKWPVELLDSQRVPLLLENYRNGGPDGRDLVDRLASREAVHNQGQDKLLSLKKHQSR